MPTYTAAPITQPPSLGLLKDRRHLPATMHTYSGGLPSSRDTGCSLLPQSLLLALLTLLLTFALAPFT